MNVINCFLPCTHFYVPTLGCVAAESAWICEEDDFVSSEIINLFLARIASMVYLTRLFTLFKTFRL